MRIISYRDEDYSEEAAKLTRRAGPLSGVEGVVREVIEAVRERGDAALLEYAEKFDGATFARGGDLRVGEAEFEAAASAVSAEMKGAIEASLANVREFAKAGMRKDWRRTNAQGAEVGEVYHPFERVGIYVPGGTAPLVSSAIMTVGLAGAVGVPEIMVCTPCGADGTVNGVLLYALREAGATEVYRVGGSQAIAAMALGTESIPAAVKIFGPGNQYVVEAKRQVFGVVAVDLLPGPSEILVLADGSGNAAWIAADMLAQAEHGGDSVVVLVTDSGELLERVRGELEKQAATLSRQEPVRKVLESGCFLVEVEDMEEGVKVANGFAPEHLTLIAEREEELCPKIRSAGAIFLGNYSPVAAGDFLAGPSHELPTGGAGKSFGGLTVEQFQRRTSVVKYGKEALGESIGVIEAFASEEGLDGHGRSASMRKRDA